MTDQNKKGCQWGALYFYQGFCSRKLAVQEFLFISQWFAFTSSAFTVHALNETLIFLFRRCQGEFYTRC